METRCSLCKMILTDSKGNRLASGNWNSDLEMGVLCSDCNADVSWGKHAGDAMLTSAITMETSEDVTSFFSKNEIKEQAELYYQLALSFYIHGFDRRNLHQAKE